MENNRSVLGVVSGTYFEKLVPAGNKDGSHRVRRGETQHVFHTRSQPNVPAGFAHEARVDSTDASGSCWAK